MDNDKDMEKHKIRRRTVLGMAAAAMADPGAAFAQTARGTTSQSGVVVRGGQRYYNQPMSAERLEVMKKVPTFVQRERWTGSRNYYIAPNGDDANSGTSPANAWATPAYAFAFLQRNHDMAAYNAYIRFSPGTYVGPRGQLKAFGLIPGQQDEGNLIFQGLSSDPGAVKLQGYGFHACDHAMFWLNDCTISTNQLACVGSFGFGLVEIARVRFANVGSLYHMWSQQQGYIVQLDDYEITGSAARHAYAFDGGFIGLPEGIKISPGVKMTQAFALAQSGTIDLTGATFTGSFSGQRFRCLDGGAVRTGTGNPNFIPGTIAGSTGSGTTITGFYS